MDKVKIKKELDEAVIQLKGICNDAHHAENLIGTILSKKGQLDVEEVEMIIPKKDVVKEYDFGSFKYVRTKRGILLHCKGGYDVFVKPTMQSLYGQLSLLLDYKDKYEELSDEDKGIYDALFYATFSILLLPCNAFLEDEFAFNIATLYTDFIKRLGDNALNAELQEETPGEDAEYMDGVRLAEELKKETGNEESI